jgi:hypothetical protein
MPRILSWPGTEQLARMVPATGSPADPQNKSGEWDNVSEAVVTFWERS